MKKFDILTLVRDDCSVCMYEHDRIGTEHPIGWWYIVIDGSQHSISHTDNLTIIPFLRLC